MTGKSFKVDPRHEMEERGMEEEQKENVVTEATEPKTTKETTPEPQPKRKRGRPKKNEAEKKRQYTITFDPKLYEKLQATAEETFKSTSQLITDACVEYLKNNG